MSFRTVVLLLLLFFLFFFGWHIAKIFITLSQTKKKRKKLSRSFFRVVVEKSETLIYDTIPHSCLSESVRTNNLGRILMTDLEPVSYQSSQICSVSAQKIILRANCFGAGKCPTGWWETRWGMFGLSEWIPALHSELRNAVTMTEHAKTFL